MKLLLKFNLIVIALVAIGLAIVSWVAHSFLMDNARAQVIQQAELMMQGATATRDYTTEELKPLIVTTPAMEHDFLPQIVPAYGATVTFDRLRQKFPEYMYKEATLNPTNLKDRAVDWETDIVEAFRNKPDMKEFVGQRDTATGRSLYLAHPIVAVASCLECHSVPSAAPKVMIDKYGSTNGFGWKLNEIIGAQIVSVPMALAHPDRDQGLQYAHVVSCRDLRGNPDCYRSRSVLPHHPANRQTVGSRRPRQPGPARPARAARPRQGRDG